LQFRIGRPVERRFVFPGQLTLALKQVAFEVVILAEHRSSLIEETHDLTSLILHFWVSLTFSVDSAPDQKLGAVAFAEETIGRSVEWIVSATELMIPAIPGTNRFARNVVEHPALTGIHAGLMDFVAQHVVVVTHDNATQQVAILHDRVAHRALV